MTNPMNTKKKISLEMAQDIGLVPKPNGFMHKGKVLGLSVVRFSEDSYVQDHDKIIQKHCVDKENIMCEFERDEIINAIRRPYEHKEEEKLN